MHSSVTVCLVEQARRGPFVFHTNFAEACAQAAKLGFDAVELFPPSAEAVDVAAVKTELDTHGLRLAAMGTGGGWVCQQLHFALPDASQRRQAIDFAKGLVERAGQLQAPAIIGSMQGNPGDGVSVEQARSHLAEALEELGQAAEQVGQPLLYEPLNRYECRLLNRVDQALTLLDGLTTRNVKLLADLFHMNIEEADIPTAIRSAGDRLGHVHFVDTNRRAVGMGHLEVRPIVAALCEIGYTGFLSAEAFPDPDSLTAAGRTIQAFRHFVGEGEGWPR